MRTAPHTSRQNPNQVSQQTERQTDRQTQPLPAGSSQPSELPSHLALGALLSLFCLVPSHVHGAQLQGPSSQSGASPGRHSPREPPSSRPAPAAPGPSASPPACPGQGRWGPALCPQHALGPGAGDPGDVGWRSPSPAPGLCVSTCGCHVSLHICLAPFADSRVRRPRVPRDLGRVPASLWASVNGAGAWVSHSTARSVPLFGP